MKESVQMITVLVLSLVSVVNAQSTGRQNPAGRQQAPPPQMAVHVDATTDCKVTYTSGTSTTTTQFCVTANGNITQYSIATEEMIQVNDIWEGYGICDATSSKPYYDYASNDSGNWNTATFTHTGNTVTVTRTTNDGIWQLAQTITNVAANGTGFGSVKIAMKLKNLSSSARDAFLLRFADVDANNDTNNDFDYTLTSAWGNEPGSNHGLMITNNTFNIHYGYDTYTQLVPFGPDPCNAFSNRVNSPPFVGDGSIVSFWSDFGIPHNGLMSVTSTYKGI